MILYNKDKKAYVNYVEQKLRSDIVTDISLASELTEAQAKALLRKCTSKLKGFKIVNRSQLQPQAATAAAVILNASKSALEAKPEPPSEPEPQKPDRQKEQSTLIAKTPRRNFTERERRDIYIRDKGICGICGRFVPPDCFTIDHIIPISKGNKLKDDALPDDYFKVILDVVDFQISGKNNKKMKKGLKKLYKKACSSEKKKKKK